MYLGDTGVGKSTSLRTLDPKETFILSPNVKELPFPGAATNYTRFDPTTKKGNMILVEDIKVIASYLSAISTGYPNIKTIVIEDLSHFYTHRTLNNTFIRTEGWDKWNVFGSDVYNSILKGLTLLRDDLIIVVFQHTEVKEDGTIGDKTVGKMLDSKVRIPSWFTVVLHGLVITESNSISYMAQTNKAGSYLAKSPPGMFPSLYVRNDMKDILDSVKSYYDGTSKNEIKFI